MSIEYLLDHAEKEKQMIRTILSLKNIPYYLSSIKMKAEVYGLSRRLRLRKTPRKSYICDRK